MSEGIALARRFRVDIDLNPSGAADWRELKGMTDFKPGRTNITQDAMHYDGDGNKGYVKTAQEYLVEASVDVKKDRATGLLNAVHQYLEDCSEELDGDEIAHFRYYDRNGVLPGREGWGIVEWNADGGSAEDKGTHALKLLPDADRPGLSEIANPLNEAPDPVVSLVTPASGAAAGGTLVEIAGANFTSASNVTFDGAAATSFAVVSGSNGTRIAAVTPAGTAGPADVAVTTPNGTGTGTAVYTYTA